MHRPALWYLTKVELFANLTEDEVHEIVQEFMDVTLPNKHIIYSPEDKIEYTYILKDGEVTLYQKSKDKTIVLDILKPGSVFGNILINESDEQGHYAEVTQEAYICRLPKDFFVRLAKSRPDIALNAIKSLASRINQYQSQLKLLSALSARDRILMMISLINQKEDRSILPALLRMPTKITHEKLANMTGLTRETVTKQIQELEKEGLLNIIRKHIRLTEAGKEAVKALN